MKIFEYLKGSIIAILFVILLIIGLIFLFLIGATVILIFGTIFLIFLIIAIIILPFYLGKKRAKIKSYKYSLKKIK